MTIKLFVYGTLLTGFGNWVWALAPQEGVPDKLYGVALYDLGSYPGMKHSTDPTSIVKGEVFEITETQLVQIDRLEGYSPESENNTFYRREKVTTASGLEVFTYFYVRPIPPIRLLVDGDWKEFVGVEDE